jgi:hypothetical protein
MDDDKTVLTAATIRYNTMGNVWVPLAPMPAAKLGCSLCFLFGLIFVLRSSCHRFDSVANV